MKNTLLYQTLLFTRHGKIQKSHTKLLILKYTAPIWNGEFEYLMVHILYQIFKTTLSILSKHTRQLLTILQ